MSDQSNSGSGWGSPPPPPPPPGAGAPPPPGVGAPPPPGAQQAWGTAPPQGYGGQQPQQQNYGAAPQQWGGQTQSEGLQPNVANLLSYLFGWLGGLIVYLTQKNREVRFHAAQSILFQIAWGVVWFAWFILTLVLGAVSDILALILGFGGWAVGIGFLVFWIMAMVKGFQEQHFKLPLVGGMAESWAGK